MNLIIDVNNIAIRSHFMMPFLKAPNGQLTGAIHGFLKTLSVHLRLAKYEEIFACFDGRRSAKRMAVYPEYKANREEGDEKAAFYTELGILREILSKTRVKVCYAPDMEADDLISAAVKISVQSTIFSNDTDFYQLLHGNKCHILKPNGETYSEGNLLQEYGCTPHQYLIAKSLAGDSSDNIIGLPRVGLKTGVKIVKAVGDIPIMNWADPLVLEKIKKCGSFAKDLTVEQITKVVLRNFKVMHLGSAEYPFDFSKIRVSPNQDALEMQLKTLAIRQEINF